MGDEQSVPGQQVEFNNEHKIISKMMTNRAMESIGRDCDIAIRHGKIRPERKDELLDAIQQVKDGKESVHNISQTV